VLSLLVFKNRPAYWEIQVSIFAILSLSTAASGFEPSVLGALVECSTHTPKTEGSNPAAWTGKEQMAKKWYFELPNKLASF
jgi:hypothetical protein